MSTPLANKFLHYEEPPPESAWKHISSALQQDSGQSSLAGRLQDYETEPPSGAWANIAAELQTGLAGQSPVKKIRPIIYRLSVAAVLVGIICTGAYYFLTKPSYKQGLTNPVAHTQPGTSPKPQAPALKKIIQQTIPTRSLAILTKAKAAFTKKRKRNTIKQDEKMLRNALASNLRFADTLLTIMVNTKLIRNEKGAIIQNLNLLSNGNEKYVNVTSPNGEQTKISVKFLPALLYLRDNNYLDNFPGYVDVNFLESLVWKIKFQSWRKKLIQKPFVPSSYNYLDLFEFKELITRED